MKEKILKWVLKNGLIMLIRFYNEVGAEDYLIKFLIGIFAEVDYELEQKLGKENATNLEKELLDLSEVVTATIKKEMED